MNSDYKSRCERALDKVQYIIDYGFDYDGFESPESLKGLIDILVDYARDTKRILKGIDKRMDSKVFIRIKDKEAGYESSEVTIEDLIFNQQDIYFEFPNGGQVPYKDFLFFQEDYDVIVRISGNE